jgi:hypothetical protein
VSDFLPRENSDMLSIAHLPVSVPARAEILLVLNEAGSYHWSPSLRVRAVVMQTPDVTEVAAGSIAETLTRLGADEKDGVN